MDEQHSNGLKRIFEEHFGTLPSRVVVSRAPGRIELAGNHTDHQGGRVVSAAISYCVSVLAARKSAPLIDVYMEGFGRASIDLLDPLWYEPKQSERNTSAALVRGMAAQLKDAGATIAGCNLVVCSAIPVGSGLSSSAAFEMAIGAAFHELFCEGEGLWLDSIHFAEAGVVAERDFFGKPCGAQDQLTSATGGFVAMDFKTYPPVVEQISFNMDESGYSACLIDSQCDHSAYTADFARITSDMYAVASVFGKQRLVDVSPERFFASLPKLRKELGDRPVLRAMHFFRENERVKIQMEALKKGDVQLYLQNVALSGASSAQFLQNVSHMEQDGAYQPAMIALAVCERELAGKGVWKIHGGGFGGGVLAFVPTHEGSRFEESVNQTLGYDACLWIQAGVPGAQAILFQ